MRSTRKVLEDHLELAKSRIHWQIDLDRNFDPNCVLLTSFGVFRGRAGILKKVALLMEHLPNGNYIYEKIFYEGEMGFLKWTGTGDHGTYVDDGADSYLVKDGRIQIMTIHYTPKKKLH